MSKGQEVREKNCEQKKSDGSDGSDKNNQVGGSGFHHVSETGTVDEMAGERAELFAQT